MTCCFEKNGLTWINVRVVPRASKDETCGELNGAVKIRLAAPPVDGKANAALVRFVAEQLGIAPRSVRLERGETGRNKLVSVSGVSAAVAARALGVS